MGSFSGFWVVLGVVWGVWGVFGVVVRFLRGLVLFLGVGFMLGSFCLLCCCVLLVYCVVGGGVKGCVCLVWCWFAVWGVWCSWWDWRGFYWGCVPISVFWYSWVIFRVVMYVAAVRRPVVMMVLYISQCTFLVIWWLFFGRFWRVFWL